ncbi:hypothetical protein RclHR1_00980018 [Rhizophagus clarus]|uniref:Phospholipid-transporting ATPase n=1 Tax=Rhizophagus clarus TaxID=94130 RepID=A0A2Z6S7K6_9GLOM|nr:hypothetical protein RclHR1_00980018 [Rhizophagus clarus]GES81169.1 probable phospholipid-transporting ATPase IA isoform X5 [Rhizophagus clarus]
MEDSMKEYDHSLSSTISQSLRQEFSSHQVPITKYLGKTSSLDNNGFTMEVVDEMYKNPKNDPKISIESLDLVDSLYAQKIFNMKNNNNEKEPKESNNCITPNTTEMRLCHVMKKIRTLIYGQCSEISHREILILPERKEPLLDSRTNKPFINNSITTSRYTFYNFLPKQLYAQFSKIANLYFLFVAVIQTIPGWSPTGQFTTLIPLLSFMSISIAHEGFDDIRRHKHDKVENNKECLSLQVYRSNGVSSQRIGLWRKTKWKNLQVGDIVSIKAQEWIPADLLLLHSKGEEGICYVETAALDGETNLKQRQALEKTNSLLTSSEALVNFSGNIKTENPNQDLYNFEGSIEFNDEKYPLTNDQILLRGTILRNTPEIYGMVIFTGKETKLRMNATKNIRTKAPSIQKHMNRVVLIVFCFVIALATIYTTLSHYWTKNATGKFWYLGHHLKHNFVSTFFAYIILFNTMIPISLYVTMEIIKLAQVYFINHDLDMYHEETDTPAEAHTSTINEELGQVNYLFSDKTGTLTDNIMLFRKLSVGGRSFLHDLSIRKFQDDELLLKLQKHRNRITSTSGNRYSLTSLRRANSHNNQTGRVSNEIIEEQSIQIESLCRTNSVASTFSMIAPRSSTTSRCNSFTSMNSQKPISKRTIRSTLDLLTIIKHQYNTPFGERARFFLLAMALCHTCVPEIDLDSQEIFYQSASPDEFAIVTAAKELGYIVSNRSMGVVSLRVFNNGSDGLKVPNEDNVSYEDYKILNVIEFSSKRKRMSIIYRLPDGRICLLCKGADTVILDRLRHPQTKMMTDKRFFIENTNQNHVKDLFSIRDDKWLYSRTIQHIQEFSTEGLRTLLYGHKFIEEDEYATWNKLYQTASTSLIDRQKSLEDVAELIERDLEITGATAIEDKLQNGVPETIDNLRRAGIKIWMLTGDKRETAINIGYSCSLIKEYSTIIIVDSTVDLKKNLQSSLKRVHRGKLNHAVAIIDGTTLMTIEQNPEIMDLFINLGVLCEAVICCRASPCQKALVVRKIREKLTNAVTLAIGDGANDIAMIQEAHVGIGIMGREGLQAARTSDYSIAQFRYLMTLLFVHGRWSYVRVSKFVLGTFYKCICFYITQGIFQFFTGYSETSLYEHWTLAAYNTLFSSLPVLIVGIFEKDLNKKTLIGVPELYRTMGQLDSAFNLRIFFSWVCAGIYHALVIVLIPFCLHEIIVDYELRTIGSPHLYELGMTVYTCVVFVVTFKIAYLECHNWTFFTHLASFSTLLGWFLFQIFYNYFYPNNEVRGVFSKVGIKYEYWLTVLITVSIALIPNYIVKIIKSIVLPNDVDIYQQIEKDEKSLNQIIEEGHENERRLIGRKKVFNNDDDKIEDFKNIDVKIIENADVTNNFDGNNNNNDNDNDNDNESNNVDNIGNTNTDQIKENENTNTGSQESSQNQQNL